MAIIIGRRDDGPLISTAGPVAVPSTTPTQEFAQGINAMRTAYNLGKDVVTDAADLTLIGAKAIGKGVDAAKRINWQNAYDQEYGRLKMEAQARESQPAILAPSTGTMPPPAQPYSGQPQQPGAPGSPGTPSAAPNMRAPQKKEGVYQVPRFPETAKPPQEIKTRLDSIANAPMNLPVEPVKTEKKEKPMVAPRTQEEEWDARARMYADAEVGSVESYAMSDYVDRMRQAVSSGDNKAAQRVLDDYDRYGTGSTAANTAWEWLTGSADRKQRARLEKMVSVTPAQAAQIASTRQLARVRRHTAEAKAFENVNRKYDRTMKLAKQMEDLKGTKLDNRKKMQDIVTQGDRVLLEMRGALSVIENREAKLELQRQITNLKLRMEPFRKNLMRSQTDYERKTRSISTALAKARARRDGFDKGLGSYKDYAVKKDGKWMIRPDAKAKIMAVGGGTLPTMKYKTEYNKVVKMVAEWHRAKSEAENLEKQLGTGVFNSTTKRKRRTLTFPKQS